MEEKENYGKDEFDMCKNQLLNVVVHLDQDCSRNEVPIRINLEWADEVLE